MLNDRQAAAVTTDHQRVLVIAGAGTGKTRVLTHRAAHVINAGVDNERVLCVTFTAKAAEEMRERLETLLGRRGPEVRTLHAWGAQLLRQFADEFGRDRRFSIYDERDREDIIRACAFDLGLIGHSGGPSTDLLWKDQDVRALYEQRLVEANAFDFDQLETFTLRLLRENRRARREWTHRYQHVLVDEYQDTSLTQVALLGDLYPENLYVVGDPRQSIYRFRGAEVATIVEAAAAADWEVHQLTQNYRSHRDVVAVANGLQDPRWEPMEAARPDADAEGVHATAWVGPDQPKTVASLIAQSARPWPDHAVLGRSWRSLQAVADALREAGIPYAYLGPREDPWSQEDGRQVARLLRLAANPHDDNLAALLYPWGANHRRDELAELRVRALRERRPLMAVLADASDRWRAWTELVASWDGTIAEPDFEDWGGERGPLMRALDLLSPLDDYGNRGLVSRIATIMECAGDVVTRHDTLEGFRDWWSSRSIQDRAREAMQQHAVQLLTVHASKGLEYPVVYVIDAHDGSYPHRRSKTPEDQAEDLRLLYVATTRARDELHYVTAREQRYGKRRYHLRPSPFLTGDHCPRWRSLR